MIPALNAVVYNEAHRITYLLAHASNYCDELVVVDQSSTDGTGDLARDFGATVVTDEYRGIPEPSRLLAAAHTEGDWILLLDADEEMYLNKVPELLALDERWDGATLARATYVDGVRWTTGADRHLRYFRKGAVEYATEMHTYNRLHPARALYRSTADPWILHTKTSAEQALDDANYDRIRQGASL